MSVPVLTGSKLMVSGATNRNKNRVSYNTEMDNKLNIIGRLVNVTTASLTDGAGRGGGGGALPYEPIRDVPFFKNNRLLFPYCFFLIFVI